MSANRKQTHEHASGVSETTPVTRTPAGDRTLHDPSHGRLMVLLGPDGAGKSTIAKKLLQNPPFPFPLRLHFHWKPTLVRRSRRHHADNDGITAPYQRPPRNMLLSTLFFFLHVLEFALGSWFRIRPALARGALVIVERYYLDLYVDLRRYRLNIPKFLVPLGSKLVRKPDIVVYFQSPVRLLQSRKPEVTEAEAGRQAEAYLDLVRRLPNVLVVQSSEPVDTIVAEVEKAILELVFFGGSAPARSYGNKRCTENPASVPEP